MHGIVQRNLVTRVKGNEESIYRQGDVNLTPADLGAVNKDFSIYSIASTPYTGSELIPMRAGSDNVYTSINTLASQIGGGSGSEQTALVNYKKIISNVGGTGSFSQTFQDSNITGDMVLLEAHLDDPSVQTSDWTVTCSDSNDGQVIISGSAKGTTAAILYFGVGMSTTPTILTNLESNSADNLLKVNPRPGVTGVLGPLNGGLGATNMEGTLTNLNIANAAYHNSIYRGKKLGTSVSAAQYTAISSGTFTDMYIGDYWTINSQDWVICDFDYYIRCGSPDITQHHLILMPRTRMSIPAGTALYGASGTLTLLEGEDADAKKWNATAAASTTDTTAGGYKYSRIRTIIMKAANTIVINAFGASHILPITELYPNPSDASASGLASNWAWFDNNDQSNIMCKSICDLPNETMVYGQQVWGRGSAYTNVGYEVGIDKTQLSIFRLSREFANIRAIWWLRSINSATGAALVGTTGDASYTGSASAFGVRPRFLLVG